MDTFRRVSWCAALLDSPGTATFTPTCRLQEDENGQCITQDEFFRKTLRNISAVPNCIGFYSIPSLESFSTAADQTSKTFMIHSSTLLFELASGVNGFNGSAHGGLIAALMDEAMGSLIMLNHQLCNDLAFRGDSIPRNILNMEGIAMFTAKMDVQFLKPLTTPCVVAVTAVLNNIEGRKVALDVSIFGEGQSRYAKCAGTWMSVSKCNL